MKKLILLMFGILFLLPVVIANPITPDPNFALYKETTDNNVKISFFLYENKTDFYGNDRFNSITRMDNIGTENILLDTETFTEVNFYYENGTKIDWGYKKTNVPTGELIIYPGGYLVVETRPNVTSLNPSRNTQVCLSKAEVMGWEIPFNWFCGWMGSTEENLIPTELNGTFYMSSTAQYKLNETLKELGLTTEVFTIFNNITIPEPPIIEPINITLQDFLDTLEMEITLKNKTIDFHIVEDIEGTPLDVNDIMGFTFMDMTTSQFFNSIDFYFVFENNTLTLKEVNITNEDVRILIESFFGNLTYSEQFDFETSCESGYLRKEGISMDIHLDCGLDDIQIENFEEITLDILGMITPEQITELVFNYTNQTFDFDFNITTDLDGLDFDLKEGSYDVEFNYSDNWGNIGTEIVKVNIIYDEIPIVEPPQPPEPPSSGGGGSSSKQKETYKSYDLRDFASKEVSMKLGETIEFVIDGISKSQKHKFIVKEIKEDGAVIEIRSDIITSFLKVGSTTFFDIDENGKDDLKIRLLSLSYKPYNTGNKAVFEFTAVDEVVPDEPKIITKDESKKTNLLLTFIVAAAIVALIVLIVLVIIYKKQGEE